jgi:hypothetical protein
MKSDFEIRMCPDDRLMPRFPAGQLARLLKKYRQQRSDGACMSSPGGLKTELHIMLDLVNKSDCP